MYEKRRSGGDRREGERAIDGGGFGNGVPRLTDMIDGSQAHKDLFCSHFIETHRSFDPKTFAWPELDAITIARLRAIPFWSVAVTAEQNAGRMVTAFAATADDPQIREALALQGLEETRHASILSEMLLRYGIAVQTRPAPSVRATERAFLDFGYEECIDAFFGFGIFGLARAIQLFIPELTDIFEIVLLEEARHVTFFVNWVAYERIRRGRGAPALVGAATALGYVRAVARIVRTFAPDRAAGRKIDGVGFGAEGAFAIIEGITWRDFLRSCVNENVTYMAQMPAALRKPTVLPAIARLALALPCVPRPALRLTRRERLQG